MSRKSRQPKGGAGAPGPTEQDLKAVKRARKAARHRSTVTTTAPSGPSPMVVLLLAALLTLPSTAQYLAGTLAFDEAASRFLMGLVVAWALSALVSAVYNHSRTAAREAGRVSSEPSGDLGQL